MANFRLLKFSSKSCQPCKMLSQKLAELGVSYTEIDIDEHASMVDSYNLRGVPTLVKVESFGNEVDRRIGLPKDLAEFVSDCKE